MSKRDIVRKVSFIFFSFLILSCQKEEEIDLGNINLLSVSFLKSNNPSLERDIKLNFDNDNTFSGFAPYESSINSLIATYEFEGSYVYINGEEQTSSVSKNDFSKTQLITIFDEGNNGKDYFIRLKYHTGLPIVYLNTFNQEVLSKEDYISAQISIYGGLDFFDLVNTSIQIRGRGNSTWWNGGTPKKPYQVKFSEKQEVLGMPEDRRWVLLAEHYDRSMIRNKLTYEMGRISNFDYSPEGKYVELFMNGEPQGTYVLAQKVEESRNRVNIGDSGFLVEMDQRHRVDSDDIYFEPSIFRNRMLKFPWTDTVFNIKEPGNIEYNSEAYSVIENFIDEFEEVLFGNNFKDPENGYRSYIDINSFIDWYLINEIGKSVDTYGYASVFFNYIPGGKIKMGPIWDFDLSYGNADYNGSAFYPSGNWTSENPWYDRLLEDPYFKNKVIERYDFYYNKKDEFLDFIDKFHDQIDRSQELNYEIYQNLGEGMWNNNSAIFQTYDEDVEYLRSWLDERLTWMMGNL